MKKMEYWGAGPLFLVGISLKSLFDVHCDRDSTVSHGGSTRNGTRRDHSVPRRSRPPSYAPAQYGVFTVPRGY